MRTSKIVNHLGSAGLLLLLILGFFWRVVTGDVYQPADGGDLVSFLFPTYRFAASQLSQWSLPLWNPHLYAGAPFISDIQAGFLYPPNLLLFLLKPAFDYRALQWLAIGHIFWAALGMYWLLITLPSPLAVPEQAKLSPGAALVGALAFALSDPLLTHLGNLNLIAVLSWLPWVLLAYQRALTAPNVRSGLPWAGLAGLLFAVANYAGHAQSSFYIGLAVGLYTLFWLWTLPATLALLTRWRLPLLSLLVTLAITVLLTAPLLLPALELQQYTARNQLSYQETVAFSLAPTQVIGLLTPSFFGHGPALHWGLWDRVETPYAGVITLLLAAAGLLLVDAPMRRHLWPWLGLAVVGFVTALGVYAIVHGWLTVLLPLFGSFRAPARALVLWSLGIAVCAAYGVDALQAESPALSTPLAKFLKYGALLLTFVASPLAYLALLITQDNEVSFLRASLSALAITLATGFWLVGWGWMAARRAAWFGSKSFAVGVIALLFFDLAATSAYTDISPSDPTTGFHHPELVAFLQNDPDHFRIDSDTDIAGLWQPDTAALYGLEDVAGIANPLSLRQWQQFMHATGGRATRLYDLLNVKYVLVRDGTPLPDGKFELALDAPGELSLYRNRNFLPRAWLVRQLQVAPDAQLLTTLAADASFDPQRTAYLPASVANQPGVAALVGDGGSTDETEKATLSHYGSSTLTVQVQANAPALLALSEIWYPGWRVSVNGAEAAVLPINGALRGVVVPAGTSTVLLWFAPTSWRVGLVGLLLGLLVVGALWVCRTRSN